MQFLINHALKLFCNIGLKLTLQNKPICMYRKIRLFWEINPAISKRDQNPSSNSIFQGFKYADGSDQQRLLCKGGGDGFEDPSNNKRNSPIKPVNIN